ncbi:SDR family NAD(P)-dependent oxidoreductase [Natrialbaceae archaeon GCM10025810]|uniref:SDR family NAD(P)-dependent oxidoreductase n=1 Tax=Halovalidus salilacus TaxID=3075124 RepID=UPI003623AAAF
MVVQDKVAVITGAASGIGRETARRYADHGASVVAADVDANGGAETIELIKTDGGEATFVETDVIDPTAVENMIETAVETYGDLDVLFNNAGIEGPLAELAEWEDDEIDPVIDINLKGVFYGMKYGIEAMLATGGGSIINTSSVGAAVGINGRSMYCATKVGVNGLTRAAAIEYARDDIRVNSVLPGTTDTPMIHRSDDERQSERTELNASDAMEGRGKPEQVAEAVLFLGSDRSDRITGVELAVDGGFLASP